MTLTLAHLFFALAAILAFLAAFNVFSPKVGLGWLALSALALGLLV